MLIVVSPAKKLDMNYESSSLTKPSQPLFGKQSQQLVEVLKKFKAKDYQELMDVSDAIAQLNMERYQSWALPFSKENAKPALLAFKGDVYQGMNVQNFSKQDFDYAQSHLRILSGLYGCLRPKDFMQAYRLEMGVSLRNPAGKNLYEFWHETITEHLNQALKSDGSGILVNLASNEYFKSIDLSKLNAKVITPVFKEYKNGNYKVISFMAKKARGMMAAYLIQNRIEAPKELTKFKNAGYSFSKNDSSETELVFLRKQ